MCTISESLFAKYCAQHNIEFRKIKRKSLEGMRTPDYEITIYNQKIIVEIKQISPNDKDKESEKQLNDTGVGGRFGGMPGKRISRKIKKATPQLKARSEGKYPALLVVYNNLSFTDEYVQPDEIMCGMYGSHVVYCPYGDNNPNVIIDQDFGPNRRLTANDNTTISALAILKKQEENISLDVYLNEYAKTPELYSNVVD